MRSLFQASFALLAFSIVACSSDRSPPAEEPSGSPALTPSQPDPVPLPTGTGDAPPAGPPPEPEWVAPQVATTSAACGGAAIQQAVGASFTTPTGRTFHVWGPS